MVKTVCARTRLKSPSWMPTITKKSRMAIAATISGTTSGSPIKASTAICPRKRVREVASAAKVATIVPTKVATQATVSEISIEWTMLPSAAATAYQCVEKPSQRASEESLALKDKTTSTTIGR